MRGETRRSWVKFHVTGWLHGSIRYQLTPEERSVWADLICWAGESNKDGKICDNDGRAFPLDYIARQLNITDDLLTTTLAKNEDEGRIAVENGVIIISNWGVYQSEYARQKKYRSKETATTDSKNKITFEQYREELRPEFKDLNFDEEIRAFNLYWSEGGRKLQRPKVALFNWMRKAREFKKAGNNGHNPNEDRPSERYAPGTFAGRKENPLNR